MPYDKLVDSAFLDNGLKQIADSIRAKTGTEDELVFPTGMSEAIDGISGGDTESYGITNFKYFCEGANRIDELEFIDTSKGTTFYHMFSNCNAITSIPHKFDTSNGTIFDRMFYMCSKLESIPELNTSKGTSFVYMFGNCTALKSIPELNTCNGVNFEDMFKSCSTLTSIPELNTSNGTNLQRMFNYCSKLTSIPKLDVNKGNNFNNIFTNCYALTDLYLYNIRRAITIGSGTTYGHLLTVDSLVHTIKELCTVTASTTLTMGAANLEKIANLYCRVLDDTTEKIEMVLCESTDEGAMSLAEYASLKNWTFA